MQNLWRRVLIERRSHRVTRALQSPTRVRYSRSKTGSYSIPTASFSRRNSRSDSSLVRVWQWRPTIVSNQCNQSGIDRYLILRNHCSLGISLGGGLRDWTRWYRRISGEWEARSRGTVSHWLSIDTVVLQLDLCIGMSMTAPGGPLVVSTVTVPE